MKRILKTFLCLTLVITLLLAAGSVRAEEAPGKDYTLERVVVLSRHNIRSPLSDKGSVLGDITPHEWFRWTSRTAELSLRGAMLETTMGQYFRLRLEEEGLFPENYIPEEGAVRFYANALQRTQATAHYFSTGLLPVTVVPVERHGEYNTLDETFLPIIHFMSEAYAQDVLQEISDESGGTGLDGYRDAEKDAIRLMLDIIDAEESETYRSGKYGNLLEDKSDLTLETGSEPKATGPVRTTVSIADALVLQYYEEPDELKAAFGHEMTEDDWKAVGSILGNYLKGLFGAPSLAANLCHPILEEIYNEMNAPGRKFSFLCGHDSTIFPVLVTLGTEEYTLPGAIEPTTPIGVKLVFSRWLDAEGNAFWQAKLVYQSVEQLRTIQMLSPEYPPMIVPLSFEGVEANPDGMIPEASMMELIRTKLDLYEELEETYSEEELQEAA